MRLHGEAQPSARPQPCGLYQRKDRWHAHWTVFCAQTGPARPLCTTYYKAYCTHTRARLRACSSCQPLTNSQKVVAFNFLHSPHTSFSLVHILLWVFSCAWHRYQKRTVRGSTVRLTRNFGLSFADETCAFPQPSHRD
jgi:hypothetical protein